MADIFLQAGDAYYSLVQDDSPLILKYIKIYHGISVYQNICFVSSTVYEFGLLIWILWTICRHLDKTISRTESFDICEDYTHTTELLRNYLFLTLTLGSISSIRVLSFYFYITIFH